MLLLLRNREKTASSSLSFLSSLIPTAWFFSPLSCVCVPLFVFLFNPLTLLSTGTKLINRNHHFCLFLACVSVFFSVLLFWWMCSLFYHAPVFFLSLPLFSRSDRYKKRITERRKTSNVLVLFCGCLFFVIETTTTTT